MTELSKVQELAYQLWEARGRQHGSAEEDWRQAEAQLAAMEKPVDESSRESFPASDAPASHLPDVPPVNAAAKWATASKPESAAKPEPVKPAPKRRSTRKSP